MKSYPTFRVLVLLRLVAAPAGNHSVVKSDQTTYAAESPQGTADKKAQINFGEGTSRIFVMIAEEARTREIKEDRRGNQRGTKQERRFLGSFEPRWHEELGRGKTLRTSAREIDKSSGTADRVSSEGGVTAGVKTPDDHQSS